MTETMAVEPVKDQLAVDTGDLTEAKPEPWAVLRPLLREEPLPNKPGWTDWDDWRVWHEQESMELRQRIVKRLTGAELAAEHWSAKFFGDPCAAVFQRFAESREYWEFED